MRATLNLNAAATQMMKGFPKVRIKMEDGVLLIKPTDRVCGKNLPKGEKLLKLSRKNSATVKFGIRGFDGVALAFGQQVGLAVVKHGWLALDTAVIDAAAIRVCKG
jgi:hypothetical protein